jgi:hypothetical protein
MVFFEDPQAPDGELIHLEFADAHLSNDSTADHKPSDG